MAFQARLSRIKRPFAFFPKIDLTPVKMYTIIKTYKKYMKVDRKLIKDIPQIHTFLACFYNVRYCRGLLYTDFVKSEHTKPLHRLAS